MYFDGVDESHDERIESLLIYVEAPYRLEALNLMTRELKASGPPSSARTPPPSNLMTRELKVVSSCYRR